MAAGVLLTACSEGPTASGLPVEVRKLGEGLFPAISGTRVVWQESTQGGGALLAASLDASSPRRLLRSGDSIHLAFPAIDGSLVAWVRRNVAARPMTSGITVGDFTGVRDTTLDRGTFEDRIPDLSGSLVVWERRQDDRSRVLIHDMSTGETTVVGEGGGFDTQPKVDEGRVVFTRRTTVDGQVRQDIMLFDPATGQLRQVNHNEGRRQGNPDISGDIVVWADATAGSPGIVYRDLSSGEFEVVTGEGARPGFPAVSGSRIVWEDARNADPDASAGGEDTDIYLFDIRTGDEIQITSHPSPQQLPDISGTRAVWQDRRNGDLEIFWAEIP